MGFLSGLVNGATSAIAGIAGNMIQGHQNKKQAEDQRKHNFDIANLQHQQAKEKMQNAYQWQVEDMKKAGINPVAMFNSATGPSMAGGSGGGSSSPALTSAWGALGGQITQALQLQGLKAGIEKTEAETNLLNEQSGKTKEDTILTIENVKLAKAKTMETIEKAHLTTQQRRNAETELQKMYIEMDKTAEEIKIAQKHNDILAVEKAFARATAIQKQITGYVDSVAGTINAIKGTSALPGTYNSNSNSVHWMGR